VEWDISPHRRCGQRRHLVADAEVCSKLINALNSDDGRVHIEADGVGAAQRDLCVVDAQPNSATTRHPRRSPAQRCRRHCVEAADADEHSA
tara:strand:+ start:258 stop:530 length:273 start_codon:yes stop_codon:yes gene_type:complete